MIPIKHVMTRVPAQNGTFHEMIDSTEVHIDENKVDTLTTVSTGRRQEQAVPAKANTIIRYIDHVSGYRLIYVEDAARDLARTIFRINRGEDPSTPDFGSIPDGL